MLNANPLHLKSLYHKLPRTMKKIMVATDYSESASNAVQYGVSLANHFGSELSLVSAVEEPYSGCRRGAGRH